MSKLAQALRDIKARCVDEMRPNWSGGESTYYSRRWIADVCDAALAEHDATPQAARVKRLKDAIEGECDGLAVDDAHALAILEYVDGATPPAQPVLAEALRLADALDPLTRKDLDNLTCAVAASFLRALTEPAQPVLTDEQIEAIFHESAGYGRDDYLSFARAILAAAKGLT